MLLWSGLVVKLAAPATRQVHRVARWQADLGRRGSLRPDSRVSVPTGHMGLWPGPRGGSARRGRMPAMRARPHGSIQAHASDMLVTGCLGGRLAACNDVPNARSADSRAARE